MKDLKYYLPLYLGQKVVLEEDYNHGTIKIWKAGTHKLTVVLLSFLIRYNYKVNFKLLLRPLSSMTEEDFRQIAIKFFDAKTFALQGKFWYACSRLKDPDYEGTDIEFINDCGDDDPVNVLMCDQRSKHITYGWILYEENYHSFSVEEEAGIIKLLLEMAFDVFRLIPEGLAIDLTTVKP